MLCTCPIGLLCPGILWGDSPTARQWGEGLLKNALMVLSPPDLGKQLAKVGLDAALLADVIAEAGQHAGWRGMSMLQLPSSLTVRKSMNVILRQHTLDVNDVALKHLTLKGDEKGPAVLITGSPGIGKSMSSLPALVRGLALGQAGPAPPVIIIELRQLNTVLKLTFKVDPTTRNATGITSGQIVPIEAFHVAIVDRARAAGPLHGVHCGPYQRGRLQGRLPSRCHCPYRGYRAPKLGSLQGLQDAEAQPLVPVLGALDTGGAAGGEALHQPQRHGPGGCGAIMMVAGLQQGGNPRVVLRTADSFMKAVNRPATRLRLGVMPLDTLRRVPQVELDTACLPLVGLDTLALAA